MARAQEVAPRSAATRLAWVLCVLSVALALAGVVLAAVNGKARPIWSPTTTPSAS